jgi:hypothetical protein
MAAELTRYTGRMLSAEAPRQWRWRGRAVKLVDGTGISMPDTPENQAHYPQPSSQAAGVGFPLARLAGVICLSSGAMMDAAMGPHSGKGSGELSLQRQLDSAFSAGDVMLADALYCNYFLIASLQANGVDALFKQHGSRVTDFRRGHKLGTRDHVVYWIKPRRPDWMSAEQYRALPDQLTLRETQVDGHILVTTLLSRRAVSKGELSKLYERRWNVELDIRNLKTTLGMEVLSCQTPEMNEKEMWVYLLAYNLIRMLMAQAALNVGVHPRELSFKHAVQMWTQWTSHHFGLSPNNDGLLLALIAQVRVGNRPGRVEPRARKRRPKSYPWLKIPREQARQSIRQHGHP